MYSSFFGLETARRALFAQRAAIDITGHNLANASTPGYRRQRALLVATPPAAGGLAPGTGVTVASIERMRDQFVDTQIRNTLASLGRWEARNGVLEEMQEVFKEPSDIGLSAMMDRFWISWHELSGAARDPGRRTSIQQEGASLASAFNLASTQLKEMSDDIQRNIGAMVGRVNATAANIASINREIIRGQVVGENVSDLLDRRDLLVEELASDVDVTAVEESNGAVNVTVGGRMLVAGPESREISLETPITGGRVKGLLEAANQVIPSYLRQIDDLADGVIAAVNQIHRSGFDIEGNPGGDFFEGHGAGGIRVAQAIVNDSGKIAAADAAGSPGNGKNALKIAQLKDVLTMNGGIASFRDFYGGMITGLGLDTQESIRSSDVYAGVLDQQHMRREAVSGVSPDEELLELIKHQAAYDAASRLVNVMDEMLDRLINGTGLVGRR
ncbi:MAG: flagellar hook-associated protein FlgK [Clostridia bacterium]|nr:flagellar hook-associated protein FlgK [Clostridia bacterium]